MKPVLTWTSLRTFFCVLNIQAFSLFIQVKLTEISSIWTFFKIRFLQDYGLIRFGLHRFHSIVNTFSCLDKICIEKFTCPHNEVLWIWKKTVCKYIYSQTCKKRWPLGQTKMKKCFVLMFIIRYTTYSQTC
jgi:hypothetical protein